MAAPVPLHPLRKQQRRALPRRPLVRLDQWPQLHQDQLGGAPLYDLEWNNGTSFFYTLEEPRQCRTVQVGVGILRPNWLDGANYLGQEYVDGFLCNAWEKVEFLWYYEDVVTKRPVRWVFYTGLSPPFILYLSRHIVYGKKISFLPRSSCCNGIPVVDLMYSCKRDTF